MLPQVEVNYLSVFVAGIATMVVGYVWYSNFLFAKAWLAAMNKKQEELSNPGPAMALTFVASLVMVFVLAHFLVYTGTDTVSTGLVTAFWIWLGFVVPTALAISVYESRGWTLYWINMGYQLAAIFAATLVLVLWP